MQNQLLEFIETPLEQQLLEEMSLVARVAFIRIKQNDERCKDMPNMLDELIQSARANPKPNLQDLLCK